jgi:PAS domain S-box-containing protein
MAGGKKKAPSGALADDRKGRWVGRTVLMDITERKDLEETLHKSEQEKMDILDSLVEHVICHDLELRVLWANKAACESVHMKREDLMGRYCYEVWADRNSPCEDCPGKKTLKTGQPQIVEKMTPDGRYWYIQSQAIRDSNGHITGMTEFTLDITTRRRAEEALQKAKDELEIRVGERTAELEKLNEELRKEIEKRKEFEAELRSRGEKILKEQNQRKYLSKKLVETLERERQAIARALHDEVGQILTKLHMDLDYAMENAGGREPVQANVLAEIQNSISEAMDFISGLARGLTPHVLENLGLIPAIRSMLNKVRQKSDVHFYFHTEGIPRQMDPEKALTIYRIAQEAVTNCLRYARANHITINLKGNIGFFLLAVEDDGIGFNYEDLSVEKSERERLGIMIMNERAVQVGGEFRIESKPGKGTRVIAEIPVE